MDTFGGYGVIPPALNGSIVSSHYFLYKIDETKLHAKFLEYCLKQPWFLEQVEAKVSTNYASIRPQQVLSYQIPFSDLSEQKEIVFKLGQIQNITSQHAEVLKEIVELLPSIINEAFKS
ncbi:MAG TPA: restriction endonuclease subunit S [Bacteroidales bacterium]|nr:restriction endonuclease subunit S [Bacteroidales bacterium]